jgi:hypothetical protein
MSIALAPVGRVTCRLIPSRFPPIAAFDTVAAADDLEAVMELEGWTNDRLVAQRVARLPKSEWVYGIPNASVVMASFLHAAPDGLRFTSRDLNGWYAAFDRRTAIAEVAHHLRREALNMRMPSLTLQYRAYVAQLSGDYHDIRGQRVDLAPLYNLNDYSASQSFGEKIRAAGGDGILYDSVRHVGGTNVVAFRPRNVRDVVMSTHYEVTAPVSGKVIARTLHT